MARRFGPLVVLLALVGSVPAQDLPPPSPLDLARGLRESGMADLALEYLTEVAAKAPAEVQKVLPLERAKCRLELAGTESDDAVRSGLVAEAKAEFDAFVRANPGHPRLPEASVALAQLQSLEGKTQLQRTRRLPSDQQASGLATSRGLFRAAGKQYAAAADVLKKLADAEEPGSPRQKEVTQNYLQAVLGQGTNLYLLADSYDAPIGKDAEDKMGAAKDAATIFDSLWSRYKDYPQGWVGRAWAAEALRLQGEAVKADTGLKGVVDDGMKNRTPASTAGLRMARFFILVQDFLKNGSDTAVSAERLKVRAACRDWLKDYATPRPTAEEYAVRYYLGRVCINEAFKRENVSVEPTKDRGPDGKPIEKLVGVKDSGLAMLREADAQFRVLVREENEYTERATRQRPTALRWLIGNPDRPPAQFAGFDECYMAALVQQEEARTAKDAVARNALMGKVIALLERATRLPVPPESARDAARADMDLARAYTAAGRPHAAAVYAEHLARTARSPAAAAKAGALALDAYARSARGTAPQYEDGRAVDRDRRLALALHLEKVAPNEPETDAARLLVGGDYYRLGRKQDAFEAFSRVSPRSPRLAQARLYEGVCAFDLVRPLAADESPRADDLPADKKQAVFARAVADLSAVPAPPDGTKDDPKGETTPVSDYFNLRLQLAQLHVTQGAKGYAAAEQTATAAIVAAARHPGLASDDRTRFALRGETLRIRAVYGQAMPLFAQGKYSEAAERFSGLLTEVLKAGPAVRAVKAETGDLPDLAKALDADRIRLLLVPTLNARVREGAAAKTGELLDELKKFGGDLSTSARVVQQGVANVRPAVDALRKEGKTEEADTLVKAVSGMVTKLAAEPDLPTEVRVNLGRSFRDLGEFDKAAGLLKEVRSPTNKDALKAELKPAENETADQAKQREADNAAAPLYRLAQLELARCYRLEKKLAEAAAVLDEALGKEGEPKGRVKPRAGGWATRFPEFRKEAILLIEARAAADPKPVALWNEAIANWGGWAGEYLGVLNRLNQPHSLNKQKAERLAFRLRLIERLSEMEKVDYEAEKAQAVKDLETATKEAEKANDEVAAAVKAVEATAPADLETARAKLEAARDAADAAASKVTEQRVKPITLAEFARMPKVDWADESAKAQKERTALQAEMGDAERKMNPLKAAWQDILAEQFRCLLAAMTAVNKEKPADQTAFVAKHGKTIADFEKGNRPLPTNVKQKLFDLLESDKALKDEYRKAGGIDLIAPPPGTP